MNQSDRCKPGKGKSQVKQRKRGREPKYGANPENAKGAGSDHGADSRIERMSAAAQKPCRYFIKITEGFEEQDTEDSQDGTFNDNGLSCKKRAEKASKQNNRKDRKAAAECG